MATQLIAAHSAAMECYRRAMLKEQTFEGRRENLNQANKLSRTYTTLLEALNRHRGKGQQKVTVEHVHVHAGGQAMVGIVETPGGFNANSEDQAHAKQITNAPQPPMWGTNEKGQPVPVTPAMPNGRCRMHGGKSTGAPKGNKNALKVSRSQARNRLSVADNAEKYPAVSCPVLRLHIGAPSRIVRIAARHANWGCDHAAAHSIGAA
jgi:hypothetical protein